LTCNRAPAWPARAGGNRQGMSEPADPTEPQPPCENCGKEMVLKSGRYGPFFSCSGYPDCRNIRKIGGGKSTPPKPTGVKCPTCGEGELLERRSRRGIFYSCSRYPKCDFALNSRPVPRACPKCAAPFLVQKVSRAGTRIRCIKDDCGYSADVAEAGEATEAEAQLGKAIGEEAGI